MLLGHSVVALLQSWHEEREKIAAGLQELNQQSGIKIKPEPQTPTAVRNKTLSTCLLFIYV